ncbi:NAD(P)/FAD-dependent oxidoreductase [Methanospirillum stamsii]|nr:NAD(P)/FAD-dependent oxidoreductase [Methanospirillum stamsii]
MGISKGLKQNMRIAIIGGGLTGLVSAYRLSVEHNVTIYEKSDEIGGLLASYHKEHYSIERFYHHFFSGDKSFLELLKELGLYQDVLWLKGSTGTYQDGVIYSLTTPLEILRYPLLSFHDKLRLALFMKNIKCVDTSMLDTISAEKYLIDKVGEKIYRSFFFPLLKSKFGQNANKISAAWVVSRVAIRSDRGVSGERLGYLNRGFAGFITSISDEIINRGGIFFTGTPVTHIYQENNHWFVNGESFDYVVSTIALPLLKEAGIEIPEIPYQGAACVTLGLKRQVTRGIYWINLYDEAPYGAVIGHTCLAPESWYGEHIVYLASYYSGKPSPDLQERMIQDFCDKFSVRQDEISWSDITTDSYAGPLYLAGYKSLMESVHVPGLYLAGMFSRENYPERSIEGSVRAGERVAGEISDCIRISEVNR